MNLIKLNNCELEKTGLRIEPMSFNKWLELGESLQRMHKSCMFWIGDWLNFGERQYGEVYTQAMDQTKYAYSTLATAKWVTSRIPISRRRESLNFEIHREVAELEPEDQEILMDEIEKHNMKRSQVRRLVYTYKQKLEIPEMSEAQIEKSQVAHPDFEVVQPAVMACCDVLDRIDHINLDELVPNARDYLLSAIRDVVRKLGPIVLKYDKKE
jgi:hypothetical protein